MINIAVYCNLQKWLFSECSLVIDRSMVAAQRVVFDTAQISKGTKKTMQAKLPSYARVSDQIFFRPIDFISASQKESFLPQLKVKEVSWFCICRARLALGSTPLPSSIGPGLNCIASSRHEIRVVLTSGGGGHLGVRFGESQDEYDQTVSVQLPLSARKGDVLQLRLSDSIMDLNPHSTITTPHTNTVTYELASETTTSAPVWRALCVSLPAWAVDSTRGPISVVYCKSIAASTPNQKYVLLPTALSGDLINIAVPASNKDLAWLWQENFETVVGNATVLSFDTVQVSIPSARPNDQVLWRPVDFIDPRSQNRSLPRLRQLSYMLPQTHGAAQFSLRRVHSPLTHLEQMMAPDSCNRRNRISPARDLTCIATCWRDQMIEVTLLSGGGGTLRFTFPTAEAPEIAEEQIVLVQVPLAARSGDILQLQLADVILPQNQEISNKPLTNFVTYDFSATSSTPTTAQVWRVLCVPLPDFCTPPEPLSQTPREVIGVSFKTHSEPKLEFVFVPSELPQSTDMVNIAVPAHSQDLGWLWAGFEQPVKAAEAREKAIRFETVGLQQCTNSLVPDTVVVPTALAMDTNDTIHWRPIDFIDPRISAPEFSKLDFQMVLDPMVSIAQPPAQPVKVPLNQIKCEDHTQAKTSSPKANRMASAIFKDQHLPRMMLLYPEAALSVVNTKLMTQWNQLAKHQQQPYCEYAKRDEERYDQEVAQYRAQQVYNKHLAELLVFDPIGDENAASSVRNSSAEFLLSSPVVAEHSGPATSVKRQRHDALVTKEAVVNVAKKADTTASAALPAPVVSTKRKNPDVAGPRQCDFKKTVGSVQEKFEWRQVLKMPLGWLQKVYKCASQPSGVRTACCMAPDGTRYNNKVAAIAAMTVGARRDCTATQGRQTK